MSPKHQRTTGLFVALLCVACEAQINIAEGESEGECGVHADCTALYGPSATACAVDGAGSGVCVCDGDLCGASSAGSGAALPPGGSAPSQTESSTGDSTAVADGTSSGGGSVEDESGGLDSGDSSGGAGAAVAAAWIIEHFADAPVLEGDFDTRTFVETPALIHGATGCCGKYAFDMRESEAPVDPRAGFVDVTIHDLMSADAWGGGILTDHAPGVILYLANVHIEPNWPEWVDYSTTNKDGLVLDNAAAIYAEDLTIKGWNADGAIDNKAGLSQFVRLKTEGSGHRTIRYWRPGPHYIVESELNNDGDLGEGSLLWFRNCGTVTVNIYDSTFNGSPTVPDGKIKCDEGGNPNIVYLDVDPRTTGEMHEMFAAP